jgi:hypothetical protein
MKSRQTVTGNALKSEMLTEQSTALLKELHLLTNQGQLNADARRKLKQVNHLYQLIVPALTDLSERFTDFQIVDVGAGKAYLGFILYDLALQRLGRGQILSVESRQELMDNGKAIAGRLGFTRMHFMTCEMQNAILPERVHMLTALHACDTATDDALIAGIKSAADYIVVVPCCQAEVAQLLKLEKKSELYELWSHGIHRREFGSHLTNVLRVLALESFGYTVTVTELIGWEHSLKNELILAKRVQRENKMARQKLQILLKQIDIKPKIISALF